MTRWSLGRHRSGVRGSEERGGTDDRCGCESDDGGRTWTTARAVNGAHLSLNHPAQPGTVSLRAKLTDRDGNTLVQTIDRAYLTVR
ncbi:hypothetical protein [Streptomyces swartbergensis]|uniref:hypothetical protein n=1 Tax=Streptomyces swartbergensis TaxID=487165 RepID=UPI0037FE31CE